MTASRTAALQSTVLTEDLIATFRMAAVVSGDDEPVVRHRGTLCGFADDGYALGEKLSPNWRLNNDYGDFPFVMHWLDIRQLAIVTYVEGYTDGHVGVAVYGSIPALYADLKAVRDTCPAYLRIADTV